MKQQHSTHRATITYVEEVQRKLLHMSSIVFPISYYLIADHHLMLWILFPITGLLLLAEFLRHVNRPFRYYFIKCFGSILREHEQCSDRGYVSLTGSSYMLLSACLCVMLFPMMVTVVGFSILIISDSCAALVGRAFGKRHFLGKTLEGTVAFAFSACMVVVFIGYITGQPLRYFQLATLGALIATLVELFSKPFKIDDNFSIPLGYGAWMSVVDPWF